jgi:anti-sigma factor RsiW
MNCRTAEPLLSAFVEDDLSQNERRSMEAHVLACRRCSLAVRELRATLELIQNVPYFETSPHFEEDVLARIRSGEALRPTLVEWLRGLLEPARLRPLFLAGAGACAVWIGVMLVNTNGVFQRTNVARGTEPSRSAPAPIASGTAAVTPPSSNASPTSEIASTAGSGTAVAERPRAGQASIARRSTPARDQVDEGDLLVSPSTPDAAVPNPDSRYDDQYINDRFFLEKDFGGPNNPTITPVSDSPSDDVFITF